MRFLADTTWKHYEHFEIAYHSIDTLNQVVVVKSVVLHCAFLRSKKAKSTDVPRQRASNDSIPQNEKTENTESQ